VFFQAGELIGQVPNAGDAFLQGWPGGFAFGDHLATLLDTDQVAIEIAPLAPLQDHQRRWGGWLLQPLADHPGEVDAVDLAVAHLEQFAGHEFAPFGHRQAGALEALAGHLLLLHALAHQHLGGLAGHAVAGLDQLRRPEVAQPAHGQQQQQTEGHHHCHGHRAAAQPHAGRAAAAPARPGAGGRRMARAAHSDEYR
jgi:hypothetical protein